ncbi:MAG: hypothetical protein QOE64_44 [Frankiales bacterium]|jgi:hypothetical protein|nr:hypothetical protein [Frankiales bacterium]
MPTARQFPRKTLEHALRVPQALKTNNGHPWKSEEVAKVLNLGPASGNFYYITAAARDYGLSEGTRETQMISLTDLGRRVAYPVSAEDEQRARMEAFLHVDLFRRVLTHFGGNNLPEKRFLTNILLETFSIPEDQQDEFTDIFTKNCRFLGIGATFTPGAQTPALKTHIRDAAPIDPANAVNLSNVVTVAAPESGDDNAPTCFVIMPFVERDDAHAPGFFDEVLEQLFTPAATAAGFKVTTANRQGSDLIQSTIVNDLLAADLVLCDLTEHNPNVLFELGLRIREEKPVVLVKARGTGAIFDVDHILRVRQYSPNLWPSTVKADIEMLTDHISGAWANRESDRTFMGILRAQVPA